VTEFETRKREKAESRKMPAPAKPSTAAEPKPNAPSKRPDSPLQSVRDLVGLPFVNFLKRLKWKSLKEVHSLQQEIQNDYAVWQETYELVHQQFSELWDFFNLVEHDSEGWFRVAPKGTKTFIDINEEGYSFSAGVEKNHARGVPLPSKWLIVSLAHSDHWTNGLGDERRLGRPAPIDDKLIGIKKCNPKDLDKALVAVKELRRRAEETPLMFQMYSDKVGQRGVKVPLSVLNEHSLMELCKGLFLALNKDVLDDFVPHLPKGVKVELLK
jgi:hypothetical protein